MNIATILTGSRDHDLKMKLTWSKPLETCGHKVFIIGRTRQPDVLCMYDENPYREYYDYEQKGMENWLGLSFKYLSSLDWRGFDKRTCRDIKNQEQINQYLTFLSYNYWWMFTTYKIQAVVMLFESVPWNLMAYYVARRMNIPVINVMNSRFPKQGFMFGKDDYSEIYQCNDQKVDWNEIQELYKPKDYLQYHGGLQSLWSIKNVQNNAQKALNYIKTRQMMNSISPYEKTALLPLESEIDRLLKSTVNGIFNRIFWQQPKDEQFFFFPFHFEDDSNITIMEPFTNQIELIQSISRCLPVNVKLYVKPHPAYMGIDIRFQDLYHLSKLPNVRIIHPYTSPITLLKKSVGVITLNSTTGFEAIIHNKPVISLGHDFYCQDNLVYLVRSWGELPKIIHHVYYSKRPKATPETVQEYVKTIYSNTVWTTGDMAYAEDHITPEDGEKLAFALDKVLGIIQGT